MAMGKRRQRQEALFVMADGIAQITGASVLSEAQ